MNRIARSAPPKPEPFSLHRERGYLATSARKCSGDDVVRFGGSENLQRSPCRLHSPIETGGGSSLT